MESCEETRQLDLFNGVCRDTCVCSSGVSCFHNHLSLSSLFMKVLQVFDFYYDLKNQPKTDSTLVDIRVLQQFNNNRRLIYFLNKYERCRFLVLSQPL